MQKIKDERLQWKNLQHIRIAFIVQTIGILVILAYNLATSGMEGMTDNPLWFVFIVTAVVMAYLQLGTSVEHEHMKASPKKRRNVALSILVFFSILIVVFTASQEGSTIVTGVIIAIVMLVCGLVPIWYVYSLRKRQQEEE